MKRLDLSGRPDLLPEKEGWHASPAARVFCRKGGRCFWHLLRGPVIGGQVYRIPPISTEKWEEKKALLDMKNLAKRRIELEG